VGQSKKSNREKGGGGKRGMALLWGGGVVGKEELGGPRDLEGVPGWRELQICTLDLKTGRGGQLCSRGGGGRGMWLLCWGKRQRGKMWVGT